jgi:hypothetical protein
VAIEGGAGVTTGADGQFRLTRVATGRIALNVTALGYAPAEVVFFLARDTSLVIQLDVAPVVLPEIVGRTRTITVRGQVREKSSGAVLMRTEVTFGERRVAADLLGRFRFDKVPASQPFELTARAFGYMSVTVTATAEQDTTIAFALVPDPVMLQMITAQVGRIEQRYKPLRQSRMLPIDRTELMQHQNKNVLDLLQMKYGPDNLLRIRCILIDDVQKSSFGITPFNGVNRPSAASVDRGVGEILEGVLPDQLERIEVMQAGAGQPAYMLRIYTRDYIAKMTAGAIKTLRTPLFVNNTEPLCR